MSSFYDSRRRLHGDWGNARGGEHLMMGSALACYAKGLREMLFLLQECPDVGSKMENRLKQRVFETVEHW